MSLEQIEGKEADAGYYIFPFGAVLYEMATGKRAFQGKSHLSTASSILAKDPDPIWTVQPLAPKALEHIVRTCLAKDPEDRFQDAHDLTLQLHWLTGAGAEPRVADSAFKARSPKTLWRRHARTVSLSRRPCEYDLDCQLLQCSRVNATSGKHGSTMFLRLAFHADHMVRLRVELLRPSSWRTSSDLRSNP